MQWDALNAFQGDALSSMVYNGVHLPYVWTKQFLQENVREESGTDRCYTKFDIQVQFLLNTNYMNVIDQDLEGNPKMRSSAAVMNAVRDRLLTDRKAFSFVFNQTELIPQPRGPGTVDAKNGPQPQYCNPVQLNNTTFLVDYRIIAHYWEGTNAPLDSTGGVVTEPGNNVIYNRWSETVEIDECQYSRRTRDGQYAIRSDNPDGIIADQARAQMAIVGVPDGFVRESSRYTVSKDGLAISYTVVDKEVYRMPPNPAYKAKVTYRENTTRQGGKRYVSCRVSLEGSKAVNQGRLVETAISVACSKVFVRALAFRGVQPNTIIEEAALEFEGLENKVEFYIRVMVANTKDRVAGVQNPAPEQPVLNAGGGGFNLLPAKAQAAINAAKAIAVQAGAANVGQAENGAPVNFINAFFDVDTTSPGSSAAEPFINYPIGGTAALALQAAAYYDPTLRNTLVDPLSNQMTAGLQVGEAGTQLEE